MDEKVIREHERTENPEIGRFDQLKRTRSKTRAYDEYRMERDKE